MRHNIAAVRQITVAVVQSMAVPGNLARAVSDHARLAIQAAQKGARLGVFPELSLTGYSLALTRTTIRYQRQPGRRPWREVMGRVADLLTSREAAC